jgi:hypothetical protein
MVVSAQLYNSFLKKTDPICRAHHSGIIAFYATDSFFFWPNPFSDKGLAALNRLMCHTSE